MPSTYISCLLSSLLTLHILISSSFSTTVPKPTKLALRLIHRDSITPPLYNPGLSSSDDTSEDDIRAPLLASVDGSIFLVNISIGQPPVPLFLAMDTGSHLLWIDCTQFNKSSNAFNPSKSSTYSIVRRGSPECTTDPSDLPPRVPCTFWIRYEDKTSSSGFLAMDTFSFVTSTGGTVHMTDVVFGCATSISGHVADLNGILGLEASNRYHLAARTGNKFSYCIGNLNDPGYMYNQLILGHGAVLEGESTPMQIRHRHYVVTIEGISVGEKSLAINPVDFYYNVVIDSGTTVTHLKRSAYEPLIAEVKDLISGELKPVKFRNDESICYQGDMERDLKGFPIVTLHLAQGADINLDVDAMFYRTPDGGAFCVAAVESDDNILGVRAQQFYNVGFDLDELRVSFQRIDCELLED